MVIISVPSNTKNSEQEEILRSFLKDMGITLPRHKCRYFIKSRYSLRSLRTLFAKERELVYGERQTSIDEFY